MSFHQFLSKKLKNQKWSGDFEHDFIEILKFSHQFFCPNHPLSQTLNYAVFPPGKIFRPKLVMAAFLDATPKSLNPGPIALNQSWSSHLKILGQEPTMINKELIDKTANALCLAIAAEWHHAYSLAHDDLPAMDNDDLRRGKASTHKQFGEWQAILAGDALLNMSYEMLGQVKSKNSSLLTQILSLMGHCLGPKGLVLGQFMDLSAEARQNPASVAVIHELKTARLFQFCLVSGHLAFDGEKIGKGLYKDLWRGGKSLGLIFQLLDDLLELLEHGDVINRGSHQGKKLMANHELAINPWPNNFNQTSDLLLKNCSDLKRIRQTHKLDNLAQVWEPYIQKLKMQLDKGKAELLITISDVIKEHVKGLRQVPSQKELENLINALV